MACRRKPSSLDRRFFLRRGFIGTITAGVCLALGSALGEPWRKMTKKEAGYIERKKRAAQMCAQCLYFIDPDDCVIVQGPVSPLGYCKYYGD
jgi:hypothetical protein